MNDSYIALVEKSIDERTQQYQELLRLRDENKKLLEALTEVISAVQSTRASIGIACIDIQAIHRARAAREGATEPASLWQHKKTGGIYEIVGECQIEATNAPGVLYRNKSTSVIWVRPKDEFFDGRFESVTPESPR